MNRLYNHGFLPSELYTNVPQIVTSLKREDFPHKINKHYTVEGCLGIVFANALGIITHKILDDKKRFIIPGVEKSYIDFDITTGEDFKAYKKVGRYSDIDFIESDFTGYSLRYYYAIRAGQSHKPFYVGGELKDKFIGRINKGEKFYSTKDFVLDEVLDDIAALFPYLKKEDIKSILLFGFKRMHKVIMMGGSISIRTNVLTNCTIFIGFIKKISFESYKNYIQSRNRKMRVLWKWREEEFDGFYYIAIPKSKILD